MEHTMFKYALSCYLDPKVFQERKDELMQIPRAHYEALVDMLVYGYSVDQALKECGKLAEVSSRYGIAPGNIIQAMRRVEAGPMVDMELKELDWSELN